MHQRALSIRGSLYLRNDRSLFIRVHEKFSRVTFFRIHLLDNSIKKYILNLEKKRKSDKHKKEKKRKIDELYRLSTCRLREYKLRESGKIIQKTKKTQKFRTFVLSFPNEIVATSLSLDSKLYRYK